MKTKVPFLDLSLQHAPLRHEFTRLMHEVIDVGAFSGGPYVSAFEKDFAQFAGCNHALGVGSGTEAIWLALLALGVGPGDEVITVPSTFMATAEAITYCGATPVFVDINEATYTMDPDAIAAAITRKTKVIIPVHLFGQMADMDPILAVARAYNLFVVEDACQAHGASYKGRPAGSLGDAGCFSFYPGKNLGALGEAGAVTTNNSELNAKMSVLRDHGQVRKYHHTMVGWNCRMDGIQGGVLRIKLRYLERGNELRRSHAAQYNQALGAIEDLTRPCEAEERRHVYHIYAVRIPERDYFLKEMSARGIVCGIHYPVPVHLQEAYWHLGYPKGAFPVAERCADEFLSLPMYPDLTPQQVELVSDTLLKIADQRVRA